MFIKCISLCRFDLNPTSRNPMDIEQLDQMHAMTYTA